MLTTKILFPVLKESNIYKEKNNQKQRIPKRNTICNTSKIYHNFLSNSLQYFAITNDRIARKNLYVNENTSENVLTGLKRGSMNTKPNQTADKLINKSDNTLNQTGEIYRMYQLYHL